MAASQAKDMFVVQSGYLHPMSASQRPQDLFQTSIVGSQDFVNVGGEAKTRERAPKSSRGPSPDLVPTRHELDDVVDLSLEPTVSIWQRSLRARRAQLPDLGHANPGGVILTAEAVRADDSHVTTNLINLKWSKDDKLRLKTVILPPTPSENAADGHIVWKHRQDKMLNIDKLKELVSESPGLFSESDRRITSRLLRRVGDSARGSFLEPSVWRYDIRDPMDKIPDKTCVMLNFPYLAVRSAFSNMVATEARQTRQTKGHNRSHPLRTLLRYHFHLSKAADPHRRQSMRLLDSAQLAACIESDSKNPESPDPSQLEICVPQLWVLLSGADGLLTNGYASLADSMGQSVALQPIMPLNPYMTPLPYTISTSVAQPEENPLIRIFFLADQSKSPNIRLAKDALTAGKTGADRPGMANGIPRRDFNPPSFDPVPDEKSQTLHSLKYPLEQCDCWLGLLNKKRQILKVIHGDSFDESVTRKYKLLHGGPNAEPLTEANWVSALLNRAPGADIEVWMKFVDSADSPFYLNNTSTTNLASLSATALRNLRVPLLQWPVIDEYGVPEDTSAGDREMHFLEGICQPLSGVITNPPFTRSQTSTGMLRSRNSGLFQQAASKMMVTINPKTNDELTKAIRENITMNGDTPHLQRCLTCIETLQNLLKLFLSTARANDSSAANIVWGVMFTVAEARQPRQLSENDVSYFNLELISLFQLAESLHSGTARCFRLGLTPTTKLSSGAILLKAVVDALGQILSMIIEVARVTEYTKDTKFSKDPLISNGDFAAMKRGAYNLLFLARNQLIVESSSTDQPDDLGPTATPEGICLTMLERLSDGVYMAGNIDVVRLYNAIIQTLAQDVHIKPSRRLLQKINEAKEEVTIVQEILTQQIDVLAKLKKCLDPKEYDTPRIARTLDFEYERPRIEKLMQKIKYQLDDCRQLRERADHLAEQNVQVLETLQDDTNKVVFVFTVVTIVFLPGTFVAGFFGMNLQGINPTDRGVGHFWVIAGPLTVAVLIFSILTALYRDSVIPGCVRLYQKYTEHVREWFW